MTIINLYLATVITNLLLETNLEISLNQKLKEKGYKYTKHYKTFLNKTSLMIPMVIRSLMPIHNIFNIYRIVHKKRMLMLAKEFELLNKGIIYKEVPIEEQFGNSEIIDVENFAKEETEKKAKATTKKSYQDMTPEEKIVAIQEEKAQLRDIYKGFLDYDEDNTLRR